MKNINVSKKVLLQIEEGLNNLDLLWKTKSDASQSVGASCQDMAGGTPKIERAFSDNSPEIKEIDDYMKGLEKPEKQDTLYEMVERKLRDVQQREPFVELRLFNEGKDELIGARFYEYAYIDKQTWTDIKYNQGNREKKTLLKLIIALELNVKESEDLLGTFNKSFDLEDPQEQLIYTIVALREQGKLKGLEVDDVVAILYYYQDFSAEVTGEAAFDSIYETPDMIKERKEAEKKKIAEKKKAKNQGKS